MNERVKELLEKQMEYLSLSSECEYKTLPDLSMAMARIAELLVGGYFEPQEPFYTPEASQQVYTVEMRVPSAELGTGSEGAATGSGGV